MGDQRGPGGRPAGTMLVTPTLVLVVTLTQGSPNVFHRSGYTTVRGPDILRNWLFGIYYILSNQHLFRENFLFFHDYYWKNDFATEWKGFAGRSLEPCLSRLLSWALYVLRVAFHTKSHSRGRWSITEELLKNHEEGGRGQNSPLHFFHFY